MESIKSKLFFVQYSNNPVKILLNLLKNPARRSMITGLKEKSYTKEEFVSMSSDHTDHPKQRFSCDAGRANVLAAS